MNIFKKLNQYLILKKEGKNSNILVKRNAVTFINVLIVILTLIALFYIFFINNRDELKIIGIFFVLAYSIIIILKYVISNKKKNKKIKKIALLGNDDKKIRVWDIRKKNSLLIGKTTKSINVDIDLSDSENPSSISRMHAVLNFAEGNWYIEDLDSSNGVGIKKANEKDVTKVKEDTMCKVECGDIIFIANTKLLAI